MSTFWYDDQFRYDGQRGSWDDGRMADDPPVRGYVESVQSRIDDADFDYLGMDERGGELPCRG